jgi:endonuclease YncB( thermonuclease family)
MPMLMDQFWRAARIVRVVDGDTIDVEIDGGHRRRSDQRLRLLGINTPELHSPDPAQRQKAIEAQSFVIDWLLTHEAHNTVALTWGGREIYPYNVRSEKGDSFDRWLADVQCQEGHDLGQALLDSGLAVVWTR